MKQQALLLLLADGEFHSGSKFGGLLGVSRTAVWKALGSLTKYNLDVESVKGKGYRLPGGLDLLDVDEILDSIQLEVRKLITLTVFFSLDSTNKYLIDQNVENDTVYTICMAEHQSEGKGRRGKSWVSPFAKNIYMSIGFDLFGGVDSLSGLSLVVGIAVVRALRLAGVSSAKLKWPNDIWVDECKISGVLVELKGEATTSWRVTAGIGLNVCMSQQDGAAIDQSWTCLDRFTDVNRSVMTEYLLDSLVNVLERFKEEGFKGFKDEWLEYDLLYGRQVSLSVGGVSGVACGIDSSGALKVKTEGGILVANAGEVSVRPI